MEYFREDITDFHKEIVSCKFGKITYMSTYLETPSNFKIINWINYKGESKKNYKMKHNLPFKWILKTSLAYQNTWDISLGTLVIINFIIIKKKAI